MLSRLVIKNYTLIDNLDISFAEGLNMLTGETGAGKSIILGALGLILGQRAESKYFFNQGKKCIIEGYFTINNYRLTDFFKDNDLDYADETILRREVTADGKSRAFINDTPVNLQILKQLGEQLIDIHSQQATLAIATQAFQLLTLDSIAANQKLFDEYQQNFRQWKDSIAKLNALIKQVQQARAEADYQQFLLDELLAASLIAHEQQGLEDEQNQLIHAEEIKRALQVAIYALDGQEPSALTLLKEALQQVQLAERYLPQTTELSVRLQSCLIELRDLNDELSHTEQSVLLNEDHLEKINNRLNLLYNLQQKHRVSSVDELLAIQYSLDDKLSGLSLDEGNITKLEAVVEKLKSESIKLALALRKSRLKAVPFIEKEVAALLAEVGMPGSLLKINLQALPQGELTAAGADEISFLFSANKGVAPQPVGKVASGGELSRLMLAVKSLIAKSMALPTIIFDEIDTGISGEIALKVGEIMERLAGNMQVLAITHLPQIASKGNAHYRVFKLESNGKTTTNIHLLNKEERVSEIAQMLSGSNPGEAAVQHARELLKV
ncbi:DNA replication and repair protein RecN [bacterium A37T11]|nr:DNA replication and repair protein RecN [bacterium A37T11]